MPMTAVLPGIATMVELEPSPFMFACFWQQDANVPEPGTIALAILAIAGVTVVILRRRKR